MVYCDYVASAEWDTFFFVTRFYMHMHILVMIYMHQGMHLAGFHSVEPREMHTRILFCRRSALILCGQGALWIVCRIYSCIRCGTLWYIGLLVHAQLLCHYAFLHEHMETIIEFIMIAVKGICSVRGKYLGVVGSPQIAMTMRRYFL